MALRPNKSDGPVCRMDLRGASPRLADAPDGRTFVSGAFGSADSGGGTPGATGGRRGAAGRSPALVRRPSFSSLWAEPLRPTVDAASGFGRPALSGGWRDTLRAVTTLGARLPLMRWVVRSVAILFVLLLVLRPDASDDDALFRSLFAVSGRRLLDTARVAVPAAEVSPGVSIVGVCMNRGSTLETSLTSWLAVKDVDEVVLVDWSSEPPLQAVVDKVVAAAPSSAAAKRRLKVIRVEGETAWVLSRAYNLGIGASSYDKVLRTDCDYTLHPDFVVHHELDTSTAAAAAAVARASALRARNASLTSGEAVKLTAEDGSPLPPGHYYSGNYQLARNENEVHLNGAVYVTRADFLAVGGYDERIQTYGWDDEDLYGRLASVNMEKRNISYDHIGHVQHGDTARAQTGVKFVTVEIDLNSLLLESLPPWSPTMFASAYAAPSSKAAVSSSSVSGMTVAAKQVPRSLAKLVTKEQYEKAWSLALGRRLSNDYQVPWDIMLTMSLTTKERLLRRLMARDQTGSPATATAATPPLRPRVLFCHVMHGLGNRLRALGSCMSFAKATNRELLVIWERDSHIQAKYSDLFATELAVLDSFNPTWPMAGQEKYDKSWSAFKFFNYMEMEGEGAKKGEWIEDVPEKHIYYKGAYIMEAPAELTSWDADNEQLRSLSPVPTIASRLDVLETEHGLSPKSQLIGVHIRNRTLDKDIKNVDFVKEYGDSATLTMEMWRRKSNYRTFLAEMKRIIAEEDPKAKFYVATDTYDVVAELERELPGRIVSVPRTCDDRNGECVRMALLDMYCLSRTRSLLGSNWSSFTEAAERLGGIKAKLAGQDFGVTPPAAQAAAAKAEDVKKP
ncbi:hypothetical protein MMPV_002195 [Pyropia vietnamensis]